jgi:hypothetical protein
MFYKDKLFKNVKKCNNFILFLFVSTDFRSLKIIEMNSSNTYANFGKSWLATYCSRVGAGAGDIGAASKFLTGAGAAST